MLFLFGNFELCPPKMEVLAKFVFFCLRQLKLICFDTDAVDAHYEVDFFLCSKNFCGKREQSHQILTELALLFVKKRTQKTTGNYGQPKPPIISSQKIDVFHSDIVCIAKYIVFAFLLNHLLQFHRGECWITRSI